VLLKTQELFLIEKRSQHSLRAFAMRREPCRAGTGSILIPRGGTAEALLLLRVAAQRGAEDKVEDDTNENVQMLRAWNVRRGALPVDESRSDPRGAKIDFCVRHRPQRQRTFQGRSERKKKKGEGGERHYTYSCTHPRHHKASATCAEVARSRECARRRRRHEEASHHHSPHARACQRKQPLATYACSRGAFLVGTRAAFASAPPLNRCARRQCRGTGQSMGRCIDCTACRCGT